MRRGEKIKLVLCLSTTRNQPTNYMLMFISPHAQTTSNLHIFFFFIFQSRIFSLLCFSGHSFEPSIFNTNSFFLYNVNDCLIFVHRLHSLTHMLYNGIQCVCVSRSLSHTLSVGLYACASVCVLFVISVCFSLSFSSVLPHSWSSLALLPVLRIHLCQTQENNCSHVAIFNQDSFLSICFFNSSFFSSSFHLILLNCAFVLAFRFSFLSRLLH